MRSLADRFKLGILTNGMPPHQHRKLAASGVSDEFETSVITSGGIGVGKPDSEAFDACAPSAGSFTHHEALMVGDTFGRDVEGAVMAGIHAVWVDRNSNTEALDDLPGARVSSLTELLEML